MEKLESYIARDHYENIFCSHNKGLQISWVSRAVSMTPFFSLLSAESPLRAKSKVTVHLRRTKKHTIGNVSPNNKSLKDNDISKHTQEEHANHHETLPSRTCVMLCQGGQSHSPVQKASRLLHCAAGERSPKVNDSSQGI